MFLDLNVQLYTSRLIETIRVTCFSLVVLLFARKNIFSGRNFFFLFKLMSNTESLGDVEVTHIDDSPAHSQKRASYQGVKNPLLRVASLHDNEYELEEMEELVALLKEDIQNDQIHVSAFDRNKLLLQTIFFAAFPVTLRFLVQRFTGWNGYIDLKDIGLVYTGLFFTAGVLFGGVNADLKEAEKMPQDVANSLEQIEDTFLFMTKDAENPDMRPVYKTMLRFVVEWKESVHHDSNCQRCLTTLSDFVRLAAIWDTENHAKGAAFVGSPVDRIRRVVCRAAVISKTDVLPSAHALQQFFVFSSTVILFFATYMYWQAQVMLMMVVYTVTWFNLRLISFVDDPFVTEIPFGMSFLLGNLRQVHFFSLDEYAMRCVSHYQEWTQYIKTLRSSRQITLKVLALKCIANRFVSTRRLKSSSRDSTKDNKETE